MSLFLTLRFIRTHPLSRGRGCIPLLRLLRWQVVSRLYAGSLVVDWVNGARFYARAGETGITGNIYVGLHEFAEMGFLLHFLRSTDLFVDVGANAGSYTILACAAIGAHGVAFEPVPSTYERLVANMALNHLADKVQCVNKAIGATQAKIAFTSDRDTENRVALPSESYMGNLSIDMTSLDTALDGKHPTLMKIDVEGYEALVLEGARRVLEDPALNAVILEVNCCSVLYGVNDMRAVDLMHDHRFTPYAYDPLSRMLLPLKEAEQIRGNTLFIRDKAFVDDRIRQADAVTVLGRAF